MSARRQQVVRGPSLIGAGYCPSRTFAHQLEGDTGTIFSTSGKRKSAIESKEVWSRSFTYHSVRNFEISTS